MDEHLLFSEVETGSGKTAVENLTPIDRSRLSFDDVTPPHLTGARVLAPVMVFKEGDYVTLKRNGTPVPFKADKARMEKWLQNTVRDSAVNYDHVTKPGPNTTGWLRVATGKSYLAPDPRDGKLALWSQPELGEEALNHVENGRYRDMSIEIDPLTESIVGLALTNHPKVKNITQFSETGEQVPEDTNAPVPVTLPPEVQAQFSEMAEQVRTLTAALAKSEQEKADQVAAAQAIAAEEAAKARKAEFSDWVNQNLVKDAEGKSAIPVGLAPQIVELMVFADQAGQDVVLFSDTEQATSPADLVKTIFSSLDRAEIIGSATPADMGLGAPDVEQEDTGFGLVDYVKKQSKNSRKKE